MLLSNRDSDIQKYIPLLYTTLWDYCLLYKKPSLDCIVIPYHDGCTYVFHCFPHSNGIPSGRFDYDCISSGYLPKGTPIRSGRAETEERNR